MSNPHQLIPAKKGGYTVIIDGKPLHSRIDPQKEAERWALRQDPGKADILIVHEAGLAYISSPLLDFLENQGEKDVFVKVVIFVNERRNLFKISEDLGILPKISSKFKILYLDPDNLAEGLEQLKDFNIGTSRGYRILHTLVPKYSQNDVLNYILQNISSQLSDLLTRVEFERNWVTQIVQNSILLEKVRPIRFLFQKFLNQPAIIIGAGPTLIESLDILKQFQEKVLLISTDTALGVLLKNDIIPQMVFTLDSQKHSFFHFLPHLKNPHLSKVHLIADIVAYPKVITYWPGPVWMSTTAKYTYDSQGREDRVTTPLVESFEKYSGSLGDIQSGGSVATSTFDLLRQLGTDPIIFLGQDLAYVDREIHARGTHHLEKWLAGIGRLQNLDNINQSIINKRSIQFMSTARSHIFPEYKNENVVGDFVFNLYHHWFEEAFSITDMEIIFPANKGSFIRNSRILDYQDIRQYLLKKIHSANKKITPARHLLQLWQQAKPLNRNKWFHKLQAMSLFLSQKLSEISLEADENAFENLEEILIKHEVFFEIFFKKINIMKQRGKTISKPLWEQLRWELKQFATVLQKTLIMSRK